MIELIPTLTRCIETAARQELSKSANDYMERGKRDTELETRIELLTMFVESADFRQLRRESERYLTEGKTVRFVLYPDEGKTGYKMKVEQ